MKDIKKNYIFEIQHYRMNVSFMLSRGMEIIERLNILGKTGK